MIGYYVSVIRSSKQQRLLLGPFDTPEQAEAQVEHGSALARGYDKWCDFDAFGTWGGDPEFPYTEFYWIHPARCRRQDESRALRELEQSLDSFSRLYRALTLQMDQPGLWVGPLKVCRDHVRGTAFKSNERGGRRFF